MCYLEFLRFRKSRRAHVTIETTYAGLVGSRIILDNCQREGYCRMETNQPNTLVTE